MPRPVTRARNAEPTAGALGGGLAVGLLLSWKPCICVPAREAAERGRGMGHVMVTCNACHDQLRQTTFYEPAHDSGHDPLTGWVTAPPSGRP
jgi:hypothetical protein